MGWRKALWLFASYIFSTSFCDNIDLRLNQTVVHYCADVTYFQQFFFGGNLNLICVLYLENRTILITKIKIYLLKIIQKISTYLIYDALYVQQCRSSSPLHIDFIRLIFMLIYIYIYRVYLEDKLSAHSNVNC